MSLTCARCDHLIFLGKWNPRLQGCTVAAWWRFRLIWDSEFICEKLKIDKLLHKSRNRIRESQGNHFVRYLSRSILRALPHQLFGERLECCMKADVWCSTLCSTIWFRTFYKKCTLIFTINKLDRHPHEIIIEIYFNHFGTPARLSPPSRTFRTITDKTTDIADIPMIAIK